MKAKWMKFTAAPMLAACACLSASGPALAQSEEEEAEVQEIVIIAPRPITTETSENVPGGRKEAVISLKMVAQYSDLDLAKPDDAERLMVRIHSVARDACKYLDRLYPLDPDPDCERRAVADAKPQVEKAIAAAAR